MEESLSNSQNFCLKLSQDSTISKSQEVNDDEDIVIISDSSSKSTCSIKKAKSKSTPNKGLITYVIDSSDSDSIEIEKKYFQTWKANEKSQFGSNYQRKKDKKKNKILYTSDESSCSSIEYIKEDIISSSKTSSTYVSFTTENVKSTSDTNIQSYSNVVDTNNSKNFNSNTIQSLKTASPMNKNGIDFKKKLSRKDTKNIIKNIRSTRIIYESPKERNTAFDEKIDDMIHPAISPKNDLKASNESVIDSENDIIRSSQMNLANPYKTHVSKFLSTTHIEKDRGAAHVELSERKKQQISKWLMANSLDSQSDSSPGIVPLTNKTDISSGNSSLERLEMNYETPNNRGRIHQIKENKTTNITPNYNLSHTTVPRKTIINEFVQRTKNNVFERSTSKKCHTNNVSTPTNSIMNKPQNVDVMECVNILDELYGKSWRDKADELFSRSEPRKQVVKTKNRAVQTDR